MALAPVRNLTTAGFVADAGATSSTVSAMLPGHEAYARVLSPARDRSGHRVTWRSLAGAELHPEVQWAQVQGGHDLDLVEPDEGSLDPAAAAALVELLASRTTTPARCLFLVWEGYAGLEDVVASAPAISVGFERRTMHVLEGTVADALESVEEGASRRLPLWWLPLDRAWSVGGDLYGRGVFVGGTRTTIRAVLSSPSLEALPIGHDHEVGGEDL